MTTLATFYNTYKNLSLTGVTSLTEPPTLLDTGNLPCKWVDSAGVDEAPARAKGTGGERALRCRVVVAVAPVGQSTHASRWSDTLTMVDTLNAGIKTVADRTTSWSVEAVPNFSDWGYAVIATIETSEWSV
jgi:hypothetical protein